MVIYHFRTVPEVCEKAAIPEVAKDKPFADDENILLQALDGFLFIVSEDGDVTYVSENVAEFLGIQQVSVCLSKFILFKNQAHEFRIRLI